MNLSTITIFAAGAIAMLFIVACSRKRRVDEVLSRTPHAAPLDLDTNRDQPISFGYKNAWLAIKTDDTARVAEALGLAEVQPANWRTGLHTSYEQYETHVFVTPPVEDWVFVVGIALPDIGDSERPDKCTPLLENLGQTFDPVSFFGTHRVVGFHAWARVDQGMVSRAYAYLGERGETIWDRGQKTKEEHALGFDFFADRIPEGQGEEYWDREDLTYPDENDVMKIADAWSFNPLSIGEKKSPDSVGLVGKVPTTWKKRFMKYVNAG